MIAHGGVFPRCRVILLADMNEALTTFAYGRFPRPCLYPFEYLILHNLGFGKLHSPIVYWMIQSGHGYVGRYLLLLESYGISPKKPEIYG